MSARLVAIAVLLVACTKEYKVRVEFTQTAADRRLAMGKSDRVDGYVRGADGQSVTMLVDGQTEMFPRADIAGVDQKLAKRDVTYGAIGAGVGAVLAVGSMFFFECDENDFPLACPFQSKQNFYAGLAFVGGIAIAGAGLTALFTGKTAQSRVDDLLRGVVVRY